MPFSPTFVLLQQEAFLAQGTLSLGLTSLRNAVFPDKRTFYTGFFNTSIALERIMKLIVVTDHMIQNAYATPTKAQLKAYGHDLVGLYASCVAAASRHNVRNVNAPAPQSIEQEILEFLSEFAKHSRYYNLDALGSSPSGYADPLGRWGKLLNDVLTADGSKAQIADHLARAQMLHSAMGGSIHAIQHGMDGTLLTLEQVFSLPAVHAIATPHMMVRIFRLLSPLLDTIRELGDLGFYGAPRTGGALVPVFSEFFRHFHGDDATIRRKKRWP